MVHIAAAYARMRNRLGTLVCTSSIGPGATNMVTGAALATINRLPVLLLPGDVFASHAPDPVLQQLEVPWAGDVSVNDCFRPVSRYFDRISRPEQVIPAALAAMRVLTSPAETGAVTLAFPQDVQTEAFDCPEEFLAERTWHVPRAAPDARVARARGRRSSGAPSGRSSSRAAASSTRRRRRRCARSATRPGSRSARRRRARARCPTTTPRASARSARPGRSRPTASPPTPTSSIGIGTRYSDFTTASKTAFRNPAVRFVNVNVADFDAAKHSGIARRRRCPRGARAADGRCSRMVGRRRLPGGGRAPQPRVGRGGRTALLPRPRPLAGAERGDRRRQRRERAPPTSSSAPPGRCPATCTSSGGLATRRATTSSTATRAWATRSPAGSASSWRRRSGRLRPRRRRLLPDASGRARDRDPGAS